MPGTILHSCAPHEPLSFSCCRKSCDRKSTGMLARVAAISAAQQRRYSRCQRVPQAIPTPQTGSHRHSRCCQNRQPHCSAFSSAAVRGDTATARACSSRSGEDGSTGGRHAARRQGQQQRLCFARACARLVPVERGAGRPAGRSGQGGWVVIFPTASDRATALRCRLCAAMSTGGISLRRSTSLWLVALSRADHWGIYK